MSKISKTRVRKMQMVKAKVRSVMRAWRQGFHTFTERGDIKTILDLHIAGPVVTACIRLSWKQGLMRYRGTGYSKLHPTDNRDIRFGVELAIDRALDDIAKEIMRDDKDAPLELRQCLPD